jgi:hypothetical protein
MTQILFLKKAFSFRLLKIKKATKRWQTCIVCRCLRGLELTSVIFLAQRLLGEKFSVYPNTAFPPMASRQFGSGPGPKAFDDHANTGMHDFW